MVTSLLFLDPIDADDTRTGAALAPTVRAVDAASAVVSVFDLGPARGDGIFETLGVISGKAHGVDAHLARLAKSAASLDLPQPNLEQWRYGISRVVSELPAEGQSSLRLVMTRGMPGTKAPTCWISGSPAASDFHERTDGIRVVLLDRGYTHDVSDRSPWLLVGAKTLSYAVNMAAQREARRRDADDVIFTSTDGYALEGPTSTLIIRRGGRFVTPPSDAGILAGTTQAHVYRFLEAAGHRCDYELIPVDDVRTADAAWLVSSVRLAAPVVAIDGNAIGHDADLTAAINDNLLNRDA